MQWISRPPEQLPVSKEGFWFVHLIIYFIKYFDIPKYEDYFQQNSTFVCCYVRVLMLVCHVAAKS